MGRYRIWNIVIALILIGAIMAIHDTDMNQDSRSNPTPNVSDAHSVRASDGTTAITNKQDASSGAYVSTKDATVKVNDGDIDVIKLGLQSDGSYAFMFSDSTVPRLLMDADSMKISQRRNHQCVGTPVHSIGIASLIPATLSTTSGTSGSLPNFMIVAWHTVRIRLLTGAQGARRYWPTNK